MCAEGYNNFINFRVSKNFGVTKKDLGAINTGSEQIVFDKQ